MRQLGCINSAKLFYVMEHCKKKNILRATVHVFILYQESYNAM